MDYDLSDELVAIESIYGPDILTSASPTSNSNPNTSSEYTLHVPNTAGVELRLVFPSDYPSSCAEVDKVVSTGSSTAHGWGSHVLETVRAILKRLWTPGEAILFPLLDELQGDVFDEKAAVADGGLSAPDSTGAHENVPEVSSGKVVNAPQQWHVSETVVEKKSTFIAHAAQITRPDEARQFTEALIASDRKFEKATHNISAFRGRFTPDGGERELVFQDCNDDGEDAAGGRLLHLLELTESWNVLVVVSRWYGGIKLGPDRFRIINQVARDALVKGGFVKDEGRKTAKKGK